MALDLRPNCEHCDVDLPPNSIAARICSYECTFCATCVDTVFFDVCPNCGGGFTPRPIRPVNEWRAGLSLAKRPASTTAIPPFLFARGDRIALAAVASDTSLAALSRSSNAGFH